MTTTSDAVRQATANLTREHTEISTLCVLAGFPALATEFITKHTPLHVVRADLQRRRDEADAAGHVGSLARGWFDLAAIEPRRQT